MATSDPSESCPGGPDQPLRVAVVGSGPAGFYAVQALFRTEGLNVRIDMFDRQPVPFGLVRSGVAPDHPKIKSVIGVYEKLASRDEFRFFGNVEFGRDILVEDLRQLYHQVIFATGAQSDRTLGIPGEDLEGVHSARRFVAWYNGDADFSDERFDLTASTAVVVGVGNVAADVARILARAPEELERTDIADHALAALRNSNVKTVCVLGRRGPVQSSISPAEVKEIGELADAEASVLPAEIALDEFSQAELDQGPRELGRKYEALQGLEGRDEPHKARRLVIRFLVSPVEFLGDADGKLRAVKLVRNELYRDSNGSIRPRATDGFETIDAGLVFRSVGYRGVELPGVPFEPRKGVIPNDQGRVLDFDSQQPVKGLYVTGWIKRGPSGLIGSNKGCARDTVAAMDEDRAAGFHLTPSQSEPAAVERLLQERGVSYVTYEEWKRIDDYEIQCGQAAGRPRVKITQREDFVKVIAAGR